MALSTIQVTVQFSSAKFPEGTIDGDNTYLHLHNFCMELKGNILQSLCSLLSPQDFRPTDLTSTRTPCVLGGYLVASGIEPRPSGLESDALTLGYPHGMVSTGDILVSSDQA
ncbi:hypothetical protein TNCV_3827951 [Trichonephila clavipes]|nr:hypothetical protein TNCV_3827951 [Trichonephila clavipes]